MAALQCDICGGSLTMDESGEYAACEACGMKHDKRRIQVKVQEITGTVKIDGEIQVQGIGNIENIVKKGLMELVAERFDDASDSFDKVLEIDLNQIGGLLGKMAFFGSKMYYMEYSNEISGTDADFRNYYEKTINAIQQYYNQLISQQINLTEEEIEYYELCEYSKYLLTALLWAGDNERSLHIVEKTNGKLASDVKLALVTILKNSESVFQELLRQGLDTDMRIDIKESGNIRRRFGNFVRYCVSPFGCRTLHPYLLEFSSALNRMELIRVLVENGACITPNSLSNAQQHEDNDLIMYLLDKSDKEAMFIAAIKENNLEIVNFLLQNGVNVNKHALELAKDEKMKNLLSRHKQGGCYIATAVYGSYDAPEVRILRDFRDEVLSKAFLGKLFIKLYYKASPPIANWLKNHKRLNDCIKIILNYIVDRIKKENQN